MSNSLWPHGLQHARLPCPSPSPRVGQSHVHWVGDAIQPSHPLSWGWHAFCSCPQSFPASRSFPMSWLFTSGGQSVGASASVLPVNIQGWFPLSTALAICSRFWCHIYIIRQSKISSNFYCDFLGLWVILKSMP